MAFTSGEGCDTLKIKQGAFLQSATADIKMGRREEKGCKYVLRRCIIKTFGETDRIIGKRGILSPSVLFFQKYPIYGLEPKEKEI